METPRNTDSTRGPFVTSALLALAVALALASHDESAPDDWSVLASYAYWMARIGMAFMIIIGAYTAIGQIMTAQSSPIAHAGLGAALSFPPFVMAITTFDLLIGDLELLRAGSNVLLNRIGIEAASLIDNHLVLSTLLLTPYVRAVIRRREIAAASPKATTLPEPSVLDEIAPPTGDFASEPEPGLLLACQPPIKGEILAAEAQEHYVKLKATEQGGMALYRFGDAVRDLSRYSGMQIHRSHWVSDQAVAAVVGKRGSLKIELTDGDVVPVSRRYELEVEARFGGRGRRSD